LTTTIVNISTYRTTFGPTIMVSRGSRPHPHRQDWSHTWRELPLFFVLQDLMQLSYRCASSLVEEYEDVRWLYV
ncbi:hypothetical protein WG66_002458, partial [Moniliophthora roreri]